MTSEFDRGAVRAQRAPRAQRVVLLESDKQLGTRLSRRLRATTREVIWCKRVEELAGAGEWTAAVVGLQELLSHERRAATVAQLQARGGLLYYTKDSSEQVYSKALSILHAESILALDEQGGERDLVVSVNKLSGDPFGLDRYFPWGTPQVRWGLTASKTKNEIVASCRKVAVGLSLSDRQSDTISMVADELITNAFFDAPVDAVGAPANAHLPRATPIDLGQGRVVEVAMCSDGARLGISVSDPFGSLRPDRLTSHLTRGLLAPGELQLRGRTSAGLGLFMAFRSLNHLVANIDGSRRTEIIGLLDIDGQQAGPARKSLSIFVVKGPKRQD